MKIRFTENCGFTLLDWAGCEQDESFMAGDILEGKILADNGEYISFIDVDERTIHGLMKSQFEVVEE